jgi:hypothetical protein
MTATQTPRHAVAGLTPISSVLSHEQRITSLEAENVQLRQMLIEQAASVGRLYGLLRVTAETQLSISQRLSRLETTRQDESTLLSRCEARLARFELGGDLLP